MVKEVDSVEGAWEKIKVNLDSSHRLGHEPQHGEGIQG